MKFGRWCADGSFNNGTHPKLLSPKHKLSPGDELSNQEQQQDVHFDLCHMQIDIQWLLLGPAPNKNSRLEVRLSTLIFDQ